MRGLIRGSGARRSARLLLLALLLAVSSLLLQTSKQSTGFTVSQSSSGDSRHHTGPQRKEIGADKLTDTGPLIEWLASSLHHTAPTRDGSHLHNGRSPCSQDITPPTSTSELSGDEESRLRDLCSRRLARCLSSTVANLYAGRRVQGATPRGPRGQVCGSDGLVYGSPCQLKWCACLEPARHLFGQPMSFCNSSAALNHDNHTRLTGDAAAAAAAELGDAPPLPAWQRLHAARGSQFIPLKGGCDQTQYERMKWILWQDFNSSSGALFTHLDANQNSLIEAHELWPGAQPAAGKPGQVYVELRQDADPERCAHPDEPEAGGELESREPCWTRLDPAFEPRYPPNPCSLSHLMLYELSEGSSNFTRSSFDRVFRRMLAREEAPEAAPVSNSSSVMKMTALLVVRLGESASLKCSPPPSWWLASGLAKDNGIAWADHEQDPLAVEGAPEEPAEQAAGGRRRRLSCTWSRHGSDLATNQGPHLSIVSVPRDTRRPPADSRIHNHDEPPGSVLEVSDAQLYLSGQYKCACRRQMDSPEIPDAGLFEHWFNLQVSVDPVVRVVPQWQWSLPGSRASFECHYDYIDTGSHENPPPGGQISRPANDEAATPQEGQFGLRVRWFRGPASKSGPNQLETPINGAAVSLAASKLTLENLTQLDSARYVCRVERLDKGNNSSNQLSGSDEAGLLVRERPLKSQVQPDTPLDQSGGQQQATHLWMFHEAGISIYSLHTDNGGQEIELVSEINGHSPVDARVDGNWNQLTLCGGLNPEQVVICEWSDNALHIDVPLDHRQQHDRTPHKYIYVGQPNLNRILVIDGLKIEIVAIVNTQPQPRKLYLYEPTRIHLSKWLRRRLEGSPSDKHAHHQHSASSPLSESEPAAIPSGRLFAGSASHQAAQQPSAPPAPGPIRKRPTLIQHDIWLLCYGQPLIVDPSGDDHLEEDQGLFYSSSGGPPSAPSESLSYPANSAYKRGPDQNVINTIQPFTPRLYSGGGLPFAGQFASGMWAHAGAPANKEAQPLRNRKSVHIIQSTFLSGQPNQQQQQHQSMEPGNHSLLDNFKRSSLFTKHHIHHHHRRHHHQHHHHQHKVAPAQQTLKYLASRPQQDLIRDLYVQQKLQWLSGEPNYKVQYAYVTHYDDRRLYRVSMDDYRYDSEIDLEHCDPINLIATAQGLLVVQCRAPSPSPPAPTTTIPLKGQLVLDQLTNARVQFNSNVQAQESYLTPDSRYLISIFTNSTPASSRNRRTTTTQRQEEPPPATDEPRRQSIIYVQSVSVDGLKLEYEIKTSSLEITECSFVWKEGYYTAILVSANRRDQQSEILSLRLVDGRLELTARIPGLIGSDSSIHKNQLVIASRLQLAVVSTNQGTYVVDLVDNRVVQSLRHHQSPPTLLWV